MSDFAMLAQRVFNTPLCIRPEKAEIIVCALAERLGVARLDSINGTTLGVLEMKAAASEAQRSSASRKLYPEADGVAVIEVHDTLVSRSSYIDPESGVTGYNGIALKLRSALADPEVRAVWLDIDSPGGEYAGMMALSREIAQSSQSEGGKPIWAYVNEQACSAAYALAAACDRIYMPEEGIGGSIGAYILHVDMSDMLSAEGFKVTIIRAGERKGRGLSVEPLDGTTESKLQSFCDDARLGFAKFVAEGRRMTMKAVMGTEADWFTGKDAVQLGLADGILSETEAWAKLQRSLSRR